MFGLIRLFIGIVLLVGMIWCGSTVKVGNRTTFGHIKAIWGSDEGKDLRKGVAEKARDVRKDVGELLREPDASRPGNRPPSMPAQSPAPDAGP